MTQSAIIINNVSKEYRLHNSQFDQLIDVFGLRKIGLKPSGHVNVFHALKNISLNIEVGQRVGIVGRNGAGKTTLLKLICGNFQPTSGSIKINGTVKALMSTGLGFHPEYTGRQNIHASLRYNGLSHEDFLTSVADILDFCELGDYIDQQYKTYSLGMQSRLQFAVATAIKPEILVIDEVLGSGDMYFSAKSAERIERLAYSGCTLLVVSHDMAQILKFCDRAVWIDSGSIKMDGLPQDVVNAYEVYSQNLIANAGRRQVNANDVPHIEVTPWLESKTSDFSIVTKDSMAVTSDRLSSKLLKDVLESGQEVYRWPGADGVKFFSVKIGDIQSRAITQSCGPLKINYCLKVDSNFTGSVRIFASIFGRDGERKAWITSDVFELDGSIQCLVNITCDIKALLLYAGDYLISTSIFSATPLEKVDTALRYDLISRCLEINVYDSDSRSPSVYYQPTEWAKL